MSFRINITPATIWRAITKTVLQRGRMSFNLELDVSSGQWFVTGSGWKPLDQHFKADNPATLLRAIAAVLDHRPPEEIAHTTSENPTDEPRLLK